MMEKLSECPVCRHTTFEPLFDCRDYTVSHETFSLQRCSSCHLIITNPRPEVAVLDRYYQSNEYISHSDSARNLLSTIYRLARTFTLRWKYRLVMRHAADTPSTILDFGCGTGSFLATCRLNGLSTTGVEPSDKARDVALANSDSLVAKNLETVEGQFDIITLWHVLEHVPNLNDTLSDLLDRLATNGTVFIAVPNPASYDATKYREHWAGYDVPRHLWHFPKASMSTLLREHNLNIIEILPMRLDAYYVSLLSEKYRGHTGLPGAARAFISGFYSNSKGRHTSEYSSLIYIARK